MSMASSTYSGIPVGAQGDITQGMSESEKWIVRTMQAGAESCPVKSVLGGGMGFVLGGMFGLFMSSMSYDTPLSGPGQQLSSLPLREQLRVGMKDMGSRSFRSAKNFGIVGAIWGGTECCIESYRARNDLTNGIAAGCITGGVLGASGGPQAAMMGCAGFAAFNAAVETWMRSGD